MKTYRPDYKDPKVTTNCADADKIAIHKEQLRKIQVSLDENIQNGWTLVYFDRFLNTMVVTNGENEVTELDYAVTQAIQKLIMTACSKDMPIL